MGDENYIPPLSTDQIRESAGKWTLAGDVGLLGHLQNLSEKILQRAEGVEAAISNLTDSVDATCSNFRNVSNQFLSLQNSQFLENRVYEDETPTDDSPKKVQGSDEVEPQQVTVARYKEAVTNGLTLLDSHFDRVELLESSDDEDDAPSNPTVVLRPKSVYSQPLPLLIGSAEWWADDNVGLGEYQENDDSEKILSASESESEAAEAERQVEKRVRLSSSSSSSPSEEVVTPKQPPVLKEIPVASSEDLFTSPADKLFEESGGLFKPSGTLFDGDEGADLFGSSQKTPMAVTNNVVPNPTVDQANKSSHFGESKEGMKPKQVMQRVPNDFTKELTSKLGGVAKTQGLAHLEKAVDVKPVENVPPVSLKKKPTGGLFDDDDDSLDDSLFRGGSGAKKSAELFDDVPNKSGNIQSKPPGDLFSDDVNDSGSLFDDIPSKPSNTKTGLWTDNALDVSPGLFDSVAIKIDKPVPSERVLAGPSSKNDPVKGFTGDVPDASVKMFQNTAKKSSLFDDDDDLFGQPKKTITAGRAGGLFGASDLFADDIDDDLFASSKPPEKKKVSVGHSLTPKLSTLESPGANLQPGKKYSTPAALNSASPFLPPSLSVSDIMETPPVLDTDDSRDRGFVESSESKNTSDLGTDSSSDFTQSPFQPQATSSRRENESTGYHTTNYSPAQLPAPSQSISGSGENRSSAVGAQASLTNQLSLPSSGRVTSSVEKSAGNVEDLFASAVPRQLKSSFDPSVSKSKIEPTTLSSLREEEDLFSTAFNVERQSQLPPSLPKENSQINATEDLFSAGHNIRQMPQQPITITKRERLENSTVVVEDDLFAAPPVLPQRPPPIPSKMGRSEGIHVPLSANDSEDDLFAPSKPPAVEKKAESKVTKPTLIFDDDDDISLFAGPVKVEDTISVSSSRSSLFDDLSVGKSTLPAIFGKEKPVAKPANKNVSLFNDVDDDCDLFSHNSRSGNSTRFAATEIGKSASGDSSGSNVQTSAKSLSKELLPSRATPPSFALEDKPGLSEAPDGDITSGSTLQSKPVLTSSSKALPIKPPENSEEKSHFLTDERTKRKESLGQFPDYSTKSESEILNEAARLEKEPSPPIMKNVSLPVKPTTSANLFGDLSDEEGDLFGGNRKISNKRDSNEIEVEQSKVQKIVEPLRRDEAVDIKTPKPIVPVKSSSSSPEKSTPPSTLNVSKAAATLEGPKDEYKGDMSKMAVPKKIGKLNIPLNLKINPAALMPGAKLVKPIVSEVAGASPVTTGPVVAPSVKIVTSSSEELSSPVDMSLPPVKDGILKSAGRDRAKIQVKRRPQTRRARQEALRHSGISFGEEQETSPSESASYPSAVKSADSSPSQPLTSSFPSNAFSPSTDGEDYFNVPELDVQSEKDDIFSGNQGQPEQKLFDKAPVLSPLDQNDVPKTEVASQMAVPKADDLFYSSSTTANIPRQNSDDDLFSSKETSHKERSPSPNPLFPKVKKPKPAPVVKSFFEDDDEDLDLFSGAVKKTSNAEKPASNSTTAQSGREDKPFVDPLGLLHNLDD